MWNYLFYIAYLNDKETTEFTGIESYVAEKIKKEEISWFPTYKYYFITLIINIFIFFILRALCLKENTEK